MQEKECQNIQNYIEDYLEARLSAEEKIEIEEHLVSCPVCQKEFARWQELFHSLASFSLLDEEPSPDFTGRVMQKIEREEQTATPGWLERISNLLALPRVSLKWGAAVTMVLVAVLFSYNAFFHPVEQYCPDGLTDITFSMRADATQVQSIAVVGDFNDWDPDRNPLTDVNHDGLWTTTLKLEPGRYEYMFIIDGQKWVPDPSAYQYVNDGFGNKNAVLEISKCVCN